MKVQITKGTVTNIDDPAKAGRIKVHLAELGGRETPDFIDPVLPSGWHWLPEVGDTVQVLLPEDLDDLVEFPEDIRWSGVLYDQEHPVPADLRSEYPRRRGFRTKAGHLLVIDDTNDKEEISLTHKNKMLFGITNDGVFIGSKKADEPVVLGLQFKALLEALLDAVVAHKHPTGTGPSGPPDNAITFTNLKSGVAAKDQLSDFVFTQKVKPG